MGKGMDKRVFYAMMVRCDGFIKDACCLEKNDLYEVVGRVLEVREKAYQKYFK